MVRQSQRWYGLAMAEQSQLMVMSERVMLRDGAVVAIRPLRERDRDELGAAIMRLSQRSRYLRFASPMPVLSVPTLDRLLDVDHLHREALVAFEPAGGRGVAVARYAEIAGEAGVVDLAVTVADDWQRRGLGGLMLARLIDRAGQNGYRAVRGSALAENAGSRALMRRAAFAVRGREGLLIEYERVLAADSWLDLSAAS